MCVGVSCVTGCRGAGCGCVLRCWAGVVGCRGAGCGCALRYRYRVLLGLEVLAVDVC